MVKHKGASNKQTGAYRPPKRVGDVSKGKNKVGKKLKELFIKRLSVKEDNSSQIVLKFKGKEKKHEGNKSTKKLKKKSLKPKKFEDNSSEEVEGVEFSGDIKKLKKIKSLKQKKYEECSSGEVEGGEFSGDIKKLKKIKSLKRKKFEESSSEEVEGGEFSGDISEQDIDSDDDLSLDDDELPVPPDITTSEDESSEDEEEEMNENEPQEIQSEKDGEEQRTIFVGNLPKSVTKIQLKKWFSKYGAIESVRLRCAPLADPVIPKKLAVIKKSFHEERNNIHGFVKFSTAEEANNALAANGQPFDDTHHIRVDIAGKVGQKKQYDDKKAVFIGNLPFNSEEDQLRDLFAGCGDISCIRIVRDKHTAVGKGFAFINFASRHSVRLALEKDGIELNGRRLRIQKVLYNQEVETIPPSQLNKRRNNRNDQDIGASNIMKFKKKKKNNSNEQFKFQGLSSKQDFKRKKIKKIKKKLKQKKETLKKVLNTEGKNKKQITF